MLAKLHVEVNGKRVLHLHKYGTRVDESCTFGNTVADMCLWSSAVSHRKFTILMKPSSAGRVALKLRMDMSTKTGVRVRESIIHENLAMAPLYEERRRYQRIRLQVPLFIRGRDARGEQFLELAKTLDISAQGAFITCPRALIMNDIITLTIPAPSITSSALVPAGMPPIQSRVKRQQAAGDVHLIGVEFLKPLG